MSSALPPNPDDVLNKPITPELVKEHGLLPEEYERVKQILQREPTLTELGIFSVMWSEHCSYKNSKPLLRLFPTEKKNKAALGQVLIKAGEENAGVVDIGDGWAICFKIESHNHPSAIEPFEGAATGVGGIIRDIFTMGARPVLLTNSLRFGDLDKPEVKRLVRGVVHGIAHYGNCVGIPNVGGDVYFDPCYEGNPLVNALCLGLVRGDEIKRGAASGVGNPVFYVGPPTGRDGLGGAAFASKELSEESAEDRPAVQKGDPFMEKLLIEACLEMMAVPGLVVGIQDMGAAGLTCSSCETASRGNTGIEIDLDKVPQRETGMNSYEIMLSESQERMLVIVAKGREDEMRAIFDKWDLHAVEVGKVTDGGRMVVKHKGVEVANIPANDLAEEAPVYHREGKAPAYLEEAQAWTPADLPDLGHYEVEEALPQLLGHPTIADKRWIWRQYDHMVMTGTQAEPGRVDAGVVRLRLGEADEKHIAIANDCNNRFCYLNPRRGGQIAVVEAMRNLACVGAVPLAMTDNLNFGNPNKPEVFHMMSEAVHGLAEACEFFDLPCVGGNVSLYNENPAGAIDPTPVISVAGLVEAPEHVPGRALKTGEESFVLLGGLPDELGGSYFIQVRHGLKTGDAPRLDLTFEGRIQEFVRGQVKAGRVSAAHDLSEGGLMTAVAEMLFAEERTYGGELAIKLPEGARVDATLYGESQSRFLLAAQPAEADEIATAAREAGLPARVVGHAKTGDSLTLKLTGPGIHARWDTRQLRLVWEDAIPSRLDHGTVGLV